MEHLFSKKEALAFGWQAVKRNFLYFLGVLLFVIVISFVLQMAMNFTFFLGVNPQELKELEQFSDPALQQNPEAFNQAFESYRGLGILKIVQPWVLVVLPILVLVYFLVQAVLQMGLIKVALHVTDSGELFFSDLFSSWRQVIKYILASLFGAVIVMVGFVLLIVPGIMWLFKYFFATYLIVDKGLGPIQALKQSAVITKGARWDLFLLLLLIVLLNIGGALVFMVGLLVTAPMSMVAMAYAYRTLERRVASSASVA